jgi:hypothetical protein
VNVNYQYLAGTILGTPLLGAGTRFQIGSVATQPFNVEMVGASTFSGNLHLGQTISILANSFADITVDGGSTNSGSLVFGGTASIFARLTVVNGTLQNSSMGSIQVQPGMSQSQILVGDFRNEGLISLMGTTTWGSNGTTFSNTNQLTIAASKSFNVVGAGVFNQESGTIVTDGTFRLQNSGILNFNGGTMQLNGTLSLLSGGILNFRGGSITSTGSVVADSGCIVNLMGGSMGGTADAKSGSVFNISGGTLGNSFDALSGSSINISGGAIGNDFDVDSTSVVNVYGTRFTVGANDITSTLTPNTPFTVTQRNVLLSAVLVDGSFFDFNLSSSNLAAQDYLNSGATLTLTLVLPGDFNRDSQVDSADYLAWKMAVGSSVATRGAGADGNFDGLVTEADYNIWRTRFGQAFGTSVGSSLRDSTTTQTAVPEPSTLVLILYSALAVAFKSMCQRARKVR